MNITVYAAVPLPQSSADRPECEYQLPDGFLFLVDDDSQTVIEPALLYLVHRFIILGRFKATKTQRASAYDLMDYWRFLEEKNEALKKERKPRLEWTDADTELIREYRDSRLNTISPQTHEKLKGRTVRRRMGNVFGFYRWADQRKLFDLSSINEEQVKKITIDIDSNPLAHSTSAIIEYHTNGMLPPDDGASRITVKVIDIRDEWPSLRSELGPLPTEAQSSNDIRPSRARLAAELSLVTGLRVDEVAKLTTLQVLSLYIPEDALSFDTVPMVVTKTKNLVARTVNVPVYLVGELIQYIDIERKSSMEAGIKYGLKKHNYLFVNSADARRHAGKPIHPDTLNRYFHAAVTRAGLIQFAQKTDPETGQEYITKECKYVYHCLRHTFAVSRYKALRAAGVENPWLEVSRALGHKQIKTTLDIYLATLDEDRQRVNASVFSAIREAWGDGN